MVHRCERRVAVSRNVRSYLAILSKLIGLLGIAAVTNIFFLWLWRVSLVSHIEGGT
jgi:hypothetical protein